MGSEAKGIMYVPVWIDGGIVKALVLDTGAIATTETDPVTDVTATLAATTITLKTVEQAPLQSIQGRMYAYAAGGWTTVPAEADGSPHVYIMGQDGTLLIQQYMPSLLQPGMNAYIAGAWQKQPLIWGYSDRYVDSETDLSADAGTNNLSLTAVPAGEVWKVTSISAFDATSDITTLTLSVILGAVTHYLKVEAITVASQLVLWSGELILKEGDYVGAAFYGCTALDDLYLTACGFKMDVDL